MRTRRLQRRLLSEGRQRSILVAAGVAMLATIFVLRLIVVNTNEGITSLYVLPVAFIALQLGTLAGLVTATAAFALFTLWTIVQDVDVGPLGYVSRGAAFFPIALLVGYLGSRIKAEQSAARELAAIVESAADPIVSTDLGGTITSWNPAAAGIYGYRADEAVGRPLGLIVPPQRLDESERLLARIARGEQIEHLETQRVSRSGRHLDVSLTISAIRDAEGEVIGASEVARDISALKRAAAYRDAQHQATALLAEAPRLESVGARMLPLLAAADGWDLATWWTVTAQGALVCETGWSGSSPRPNPLGEDPLAPGLVAALSAARAPLWADSANPADEGDLPPPGFASALWIPALADRDPAGGFLFLSRSRRPRDDELIATLAGVASQLGQFIVRVRAQRESKRLKDEFFNMISHELRTPLTSIIGYTDLIAEIEAPRLSDQGRRFIEVIERNAKRQLRLVHDLLLLIRVEAGEFSIERQPLDLAAVVDQAVEEARRAAEQSGISVQLSLEDRPVIEGDPHRLEQLLDNLLNNAIKFSEADGIVRICLRRENGTALIEVADSGIGIPPQERERLFERLFRASAAKALAIPGTGLGLTIVKTVVDAHGGTIAVESEEGCGTTFKVSLPLAREAAMAALAQRQRTITGEDER